ncbi:hypothetical protein OROGR_000137 [Orobanche gracilis]
MSTSVLTAATADHHQAPNPNPHHDHDGRHPIRRGSGRRKIKGCDSSSSSVQKKNKQPQRGMGVEKLECLRLQDSFKHHHPAGPGVVLSAFPDQIPKLGGFGAPDVGLNQNNPGGGAYPGHFQYGQMDVFRLNHSGFAGKNYVSGNLSSREHCNACHRKKRFNGGDCGFLGLNNIGEYKKVISQENQQGLIVGTKMPLQGNNGKLGHVEIVVVHRKGSSSSPSPSSSELSGHDEHVMMEYEFFPSSRKSDHDDELVMMNLGSSSSSLSSETPSSSSSTMPGFVDLSLKFFFFFFFFFLNSTQNNGNEGGRS